MSDYVRLLEAELARVRAEHETEHRGMGTGQLLLTLNSENRMLAKKVASTEAELGKLRKRIGHMEKALREAAKLVPGGDAETVLPVREIARQIQEALGECSG